MDESINSPGQLAMFLLIVCTLLGAILIYRRRKKTNRKGKDNAGLSQQAALLSARLELQQPSLSLIRGELHDNIGHMLVLARLNLNTVYQHLNIGDHGTQLVDNSLQLLTTVIRDLKEISESISGTLSEESGLIVLLQRDLAMIQDCTDIRCLFQVSMTELRLAPAKEHLLYRIIQEALQNVMKHAHANRILLSISESRGLLTVLIEDDGLGFDPAAKAESKGLGLRNMYNRACVLGADLHFSSVPGTGTVVVISLPVLNGNFRDITFE